MQSAKLNHLVVIKSLVSSQDVTTGIVTPSWVTFATVWAEVRPASVREFIAAGISESKVSAAIKIRFLAGIKPSMRVEDGDDLYNIEGVLPDPKTGREYITLPASQILTG
ncbi:MAG: phage head closure protein [Betaproteobacteria bacterium]|nr:phage head closure protein [Betaproteobacteria bacterium]